MKDSSTFRRRPAAGSIFGYGEITILGTLELARVSSTLSVADVSSFSTASMPTSKFLLLDFSYNGAGWRLEDIQALDEVPLDRCTSILTLVAVYFCYAY
jgi:hypothetical protein